MIGEPVVYLRNVRELDRRDIHGLVGWGRRPSTNKPRTLAEQRGLPFLHLEDGFLRSYGTGSTHPTLSLVVDPEGIYYDATQPSRLENLLASPANLLTGVGEDAQRARTLIVEHRLSKYNVAPACPPLNDGAAKRILVVDQTVGDAGIAFGRATAHSFSEMLQAALTDHPGATVYIKTHPEVTRGDKRGFYSDQPLPRNVKLLSGSYNPISLLTQMDHVYVATSQLGFEALLLGKPVDCFGMPWYAGWGATRDRLTTERRQRRRSVDELFAAAYLHYTRYLNPETHAAGTIFDVITWLQRQYAGHAPGRSIAIGFRRWKAANVSPFLGQDVARTHFVRNPDAARRLKPTVEDRLIVWGSPPSPKVVELADKSGASIVRMEDGFIRSVGLGSDFVAPRALVLDETGIYFDARRPSTLENLLNQHAFTPHEIQRAQRIRELIVTHQLTKYNIETIASPSWNSKGKHIVLVPGQVEDDASIRFGAPAIQDNLALLAAARAAQPNAYIVYKPHPDVSVRNRKGRVHQTDALRYADVIETQVSIVNCLAHCDEVHTMTSLSGFEGLLHGKTVITYGCPFYAGWGLTIDRLTIPRRHRSLTLPELIAGTLLLYPLYWDWTLNGLTTCEAALGQIIQERDSLLSNGNFHTIRKNYVQRQWHKIKIWAQAGFTIRQ